MANTIVSSGTVRLSLNSTTVTSDVGFNITMTGSNYQSEAINVTGSVWTALNTSSLSDMRWLVASNEGSGSIQISKDSSGTVILATLESQDSCIIPCTGSIASNSLFAKSIVTSSVLQYFVVER